MDNPALKEIKNLTKEALVELLQVYSRNWMTLDGLWFSGVEEKFGLDAALELDIRMWKIGSRIEAQRIKKFLKIDEGGLDNIMRVVNLMSWAPSFGYHYEVKEDTVIWTCTKCLPQEQRAKTGKEEFPCKPTFEACFYNVCRVIDPLVKVECIFCPPDPHPDDAWCQWKLFVD